MQALQLRALIFPVQENHRMGSPEKTAKVDCQARVQAAMVKRFSRKEQADICKATVKK